MTALAATTTPPKEKKQAKASNDSAESIYKAQVNIIAACNTLSEIEYVRNCIKNTVTDGFSRQLAAELYRTLETRKREIEDARAASEAAAD